MSSDFQFPNIEANLLGYLFDGIGIYFFFWHKNIYISSLFKCDSRDNNIFLNKISYQVY